ncbi:hemolysin type calcium-binding protein [Shimia isoporae]|uniref:Hemolysin type calcium-binding protein n=1 Tax=Shimia isoporae TaxID=647720 RepID=A0A4R1NL64_9RHOB|nr:calcium-binding protein [Shimia isoporae]TCL09086.1 hemolysin type calcium-binding protein [Shimia isoporae]
MPTTITIDTDKAPIEVKQDMFGGNILSDTNETDGTPNDSFVEAADALGVSHLRYPGGRAVGEDITQLDTLATGFDQLDADLRAYLDWAKATGTSTTLVVAALDETHTDPAELKAWSQLVLDYMGADAHLIKAYEIGNEFWQTIDETEYGANARAITEALNSVTVDGYQPDIYVQTANVTGGQSNYKGSSNGSISDADAKAAMQHWEADQRPDDWLDGMSASDFYHSLNDYEQRIIKGNLELMQELDADGDITNGFQFDSSNGFDGIVAHYYYNDWEGGFDLTENDSKMEVRNLDLRFAVWEGLIPDDVDIRVTEWNVDSNNYSALGLRAAGTTIEMFANMLELGVDGAEFWAMRHNTSSSVAGPHLDNRAIEYTPAGLAIQHLSDAFENAGGSLELITVEGFNPSEMEVNVFNSEDYVVVYVMSMSDDFGKQFDLDLSGLVDGALDWNAIKFGIDENSSDGLSENRAYDEDGLLVSRNPKRVISNEERDALIAKLGDAFSDGMIKLSGGVWKTYLPHPEDILLRPGVTNPTSLEDFYYPTESDVIGMETYFSRDALGGSVAEFSFELDPYELIAITIKKADAAIHQTGTDKSEYFAGGSGNDVFHGGNGADTIRSKEGDDTLYGEKGNDHLVAGKGEDILYGGGGRDNLEGEDGNDRLFGGNGRDTLRGGDGDDTLYGENGDDYLYGDAGNDLMYGGIGSDRLYGYDDNDTMYGDAGTDTLYGGNGNDVMNGGDDNDTLYGQNGNDILFGDAGNDFLSGGEGHDVLKGGTGNDRLYGGRGNDTMTGGDGADVFEYKNGDGMDVITDFNTAEGDILKLAGVKTIDDWNDLVSNHLIQDGNNVIVHMGSTNHITLNNVSIGDLTADDFLF